MQKTEREKLAEASHESWSHWMSHLFGKCVKDDVGNATIPHELVKRWQRQIQTPYDLLSEAEKSSDLAQADRMLHAIGR